MGNVLPYTKKQFDLSGLHGISDKTMETHFKLSTVLHFRYVVVGAASPP